MAEKFKLGHCGLIATLHWTMFPVLWWYTKKVRTVLKGLHYQATSPYCLDHHAWLNSLAHPGTCLASSFQSERKILGQGTAPCSSGKTLAWKLKPVAWRTSDKQKTTFCLLGLQGLVLAQSHAHRPTWVRHCRVEIETSDFEVCSGNPMTQTCRETFFLYKTPHCISCCSMTTKPASCTLILPGFCSRLVFSCLQCSQDNLRETLLNYQDFVPRIIPGGVGQKMVPLIRTSFV